MASFKSARVGVIKPSLTVIGKRPFAGLGPLAFTVKVNAILECEEGEQRVRRFASSTSLAQLHTSLETPVKVGAPSNTLHVPYGSSRSSKRRDPGKIHQGQEGRRGNLRRRLLGQGGRHREEDRHQEGTLNFPAVGPRECCALQSRYEREVGLMKLFRLCRSRSDSSRMVST